MEQCAVSIVCVTYNQVRYLPKAIDSILSQVTDFPFEIIIHDDVSTDGTKEVIRDYEKKYPQIIRAIYEKENQYSKGIDYFADIVNKIANGKYIAICEGDDFWLDNNKLQIQYNAMESHPECDMCACMGCTVSENGEEEVSVIRPMKQDGFLTVEEVIKGGGQYLVTAGLFFRRSMYKEMLPFEKVIPLDYAQQIKGALRGGIYYIDRKMAAYRRYADGSWTNIVLKDKTRLKKQWEKEIALLKQLNIDTKEQFSEAIHERLKAYIPFDEQLSIYRDEIIRLMNGLQGKRFIWGRGRRGDGLEAFFAKEKIEVDGVCDIINTGIGGKTEFGNTVVHTSYVWSEASVILASNQYAYDDILKNGFSGQVINFQKYMPW